MRNRRGFSGLVLLLSSLSPAAVAAGPAATGESAVHRQLVQAKAALMAADYHADLRQLAILRDQVAAWTSDPELGYLAHYWSGYASWRIALNAAAKPTAGGPDLKPELQRAVREFEASMAGRESFADAYAAASAVHAWLSTMDADAMKVHVIAAGKDLARAKELEPHNPRVLWVEGAHYLFTPPQFGGDPQRAIEVYRAELAASTPPVPDSPLPDWGRPEALMSLAYAALRGKPPDFAEARKQAEETLRAQPDWSYVRDVLLPMIERERQAAESAPHSRR